MTPLPTYTSVFRMRRRLYAVYDWELPVPVGLFEATVFIGAVVIFALVAQAFGMGLTPANAWFYVVPPVFVAYLARQPVADGKQPLDWLSSHARYALEPRVIHRLTDARGPRSVTIAADVWLERSAGDTRSRR